MFLIIKSWKRRGIVINFVNSLVISKIFKNYCIYATVYFEIS